MEKTNPSPAHWQLLNESLHADCHIFEIYKQHHQHPDQRAGDFYVIKCPDWVQVLALTPEKKIILVQQYRFGSQALSWEVPGGVIDPEDPDPVIAGTRELAEETGYAGQNARIIHWCYPNPAIQNNRTHFVLVEACEIKQAQDTDEHEELIVSTFTLQEVKAMVKKGEITHSIALNALYFLEQHWPDLG